MAIIRSFLLTGSLAKRDLEYKHKYDGFWEILYLRFQLFDEYDTMGGGWVLPFLGGIGVSRR